MNDKGNKSVKCSKSAERIAKHIARQVYRKEFVDLTAKDVALIDQLMFEARKDAVSHLLGQYGVTDTDGWTVVNVAQGVFRLERKID